MKQYINISGIISIILICLGAIFKINHWPGASIMLVIGIFTLLVLFSPFALLNNFKANEKKGKAFYFISYLTVFVVFTGALFKIMHWPGAGTLLIIAIPFPFLVFLPFLLYHSKKNESFTVNNLIIILFFIAYVGVSSSFLALNFSKTTIDEGFTLE